MPGPKSRPLFILASLCCCALISAHAAVPQDASGRFVLDEAGGRLNHGSPGASIVTPSPIQKAAASLPQSPRPFWQYGIFGSSIGASGIHIQGQGAAAEIILGGSGSGNFWGNDFWYVLRRNTNTSSYDKVFISPTYGSVVRRIAYGSVITNSSRQIVVALENGEIWLYDSVSRALLSRLITGSTINAICLADIEGDDLAEILAVNDSGLTVYNGRGAFLWSVPDAGGYDVVAGQMDGDAAIEIAVNSGKIIDAGTRALQWIFMNRATGRLALANVDDDAKLELIVSDNWYWIYAYDVDRKLPKWSVPTDLDIGAIQVADVDGDSTPELLVGDGQWGDIHVYDLRTQMEKWSVHNPEHGVTWIAAGNVDEDGANEIIWGAGASSTGPDNLFVADGSRRAIEWSSADIEGPFIGASIGDLDGDGRLELVACTTASDAGYGSGRIVVFDVESGLLRATSQPIVNSVSWTSPHDLKLRDLNGDSRPEIVIGADWLYDGYIEAYSFSTANVFTVVWTNFARPSGEPFTAVEVYDLDGDGVPEVIAGNGAAHTGADGTFVRIFDSRSGAQTRRSINLADSFWTGVSHVTVDDSTGTPLIVARTSQGIYVLSGADLALEQILSGDYSAFSGAPDRNGFVAVKNGTATIFRLRDGEFEAVESWLLSSGEVNNITWAEPTAFWFNAGGALSRFDLPFGDITWSVAGLDESAGKFLARLGTAAGETIYFSDQTRLMGFHVMEQTLVSVAMSRRSANESDSTPVAVRFHRHGDTNEALTVTFTVGGSAERGTDYILAGTSNQVVFAPGMREVELEIGALDDRFLEMDETVVIILDAEGLPASNPAILTIVSDDARITMTTSANTAFTEQEPVRVTFVREGPTRLPLFLDVHLGGTAVFGVDFTADTNSIVIPAGETSVVLSLYALTNATPDSVIEITLLAGPTYTAPVNSASVSIQRYRPPALVWVTAEQSAGEDPFFPVTGQFRIQVDAPLDEPLTVYFNLSGSAINGRDYENRTPSVTIPAGESNVIVHIIPLDDRIAEGEETMTLRLQPATGYLVHSYLREATLFIWDDEPALEILGCLLNEPDARGRRSITTRVAPLAGMVREPLSFVFSWKEQGPGLRSRTHYRRVRFPANAADVTLQLPLSKRPVDQVTLRIKPDTRVRPRYSIGPEFDFTFPIVPAE